MADEKVTEYPEFTYRVVLEIRLEGPEENWDKLADDLRAKVRRLPPINGNWAVTSVFVDTAAEVEVEND